MNEQLHLNLHYAYEFNHYQMFATINNILEENIYHPDVRTNQNAIIQASDKANAMLGIKAQF